LNEFISINLLTYFTNGCLQKQTVAKIYPESSVVFFTKYELKDCWLSNWCCKISLWPKYAEDLSQIWTWMLKIHCILQAEESVYW